MSSQRNLAPLETNEADIKEDKFVCEQKVCECADCQLRKPTVEHTDIKPKVNEQTRKKVHPGQVIFLGLIFTAVAGVCDSLFQS